MCAVDTNFALEIAETAQALRRAFDRRAAGLGVTRAQWRVLARLARKDGQRQVELADALDVEPITLCRMVDRLSEGGLVERRPDELDRRAWRIHLTTKAGPLIEELSALADGFHDDITAGIAPAEQAEVRRILEQMRSNIAAIGDPARRIS